MTEIFSRGRNPDLTVAINGAKLKQAMVYRLTELRSEKEHLLPAAHKIADQAPAEDRDDTY